MSAPDPVTPLTQAVDLNQDPDQAPDWPRDAAGLPDVDQLVSWTERLAAVVSQSRLAGLAISVGGVRWEFTAPVAAPAAAPAAVAMTVPPVAVAAPAPVAAVPDPAAAVPDPAAPPAADPAAPAPAAAEQVPAVTVTAPLVGVFYRAPEPGQPPFVEVGDQIEAGRQVGLIEAMKMMNEVVAAQAGTVREIHVPNGEVVEFGQVLVTIEPA